MFGENGNLVDRGECREATSRRKEVPNRDKSSSQDQMKMQKSLVNHTHSCHDNVQSRDAGRNEGTLKVGAGLEDAGRHPFRQEVHKYRG